MIGRIVFGCFLIAVGVAYGIVGAGYPPMGLQEGFGPGLFPVIIAWIIAVFAALETAQNVMTLRKIKKATVKADAAALTGPAFGVDGAEAVGSAILVAAVAAAVLLMPVVGFVAAGAGLLLVLSVVMGMRPLWKSAVVSLVVAGSLFLIFSRGFDVIFAF